MRRHVPAEKHADCLAHWDTTPRKTGEDVLVGRKTMVMPFDGYFVFADLLPLANWGHPARCLLISSDGEEVQAFEAEFPPYLGFYPDSYRELRLT